MENLESQLVKINAYVPLQESLGLRAELSAASSGQVVAQCIFDHWNTMSGDPIDVGDGVGRLVQNIRKRKGLLEVVPDLSNFYDEL